MKLIPSIVFVFFSTGIFACSDEGWEGMNFYNLFAQTSISAQEYYPFLRAQYTPFFEDGNPENNIYTPHGNVSLWQEFLTDWEKEDIENAVYNFSLFDWKKRKSKKENRAKLYLEFAQQCSDEFNYRINRQSWNYDEIIKDKVIDSQGLLAKANLLLTTEENEQLRARYYYQIIRILHYSSEWADAVKFFESKVENQLPKNEIYYYIVDQVAGCYYSLEDHNKAAYLFAKVVNHSIDRKESAFKSFSFCSYRQTSGDSYFTNLEDEKDLLLLISLRDFYNELDNLQKFIALDANDERVELLFIRALNNLEREVWPKNIGIKDQTLPQFKEDSKNQELLEIAEEMAANKKVDHHDFWTLVSSYLSFINQDVAQAESKLRSVHSYPNQKKALSVMYTVFSWKSISPNNEKYIASILEEFPETSLDPYSDDFNREAKSNIRPFILDKIAHTYYKNGKIAKAFLVHHAVLDADEIGSLKLLNALEAFYNKPNKTEFEKILLPSSEVNTMDIINHQKGIYFLYHDQAELALEHFEKSKDINDITSIPNTIFSNNIKECFSCDVSEIMVDEIYKVDVFSFIKNTFTPIELSEYFIELKRISAEEKKWKAKLANYLIANFYFNTSNTGYYRGSFSNFYGNCCDYNFVMYADQDYGRREPGEKIIDQTSGYNLSTIKYRVNRYYGLSDVAMKYYQQVIDLSSDKELNARCLYMMAKCELNDFYNNGSEEFFTIPVNSYHNLNLPLYDSFKTMKEDYADTQFYDMIIKECSYFKSYSNHN